MFYYTYQAEVPAVTFTKAPWWLRWWKKRIPSETTEWRQFAFSCNEPNVDEAVRKYQDFLPFNHVRYVSLTQECTETRIGASVRLEKYQSHIDKYGR